MSERNTARWTTQEREGQRGREDRQKEGAREVEKKEKQELEKAEND